MELIETCFLTNINVVICHYAVTLVGSNEHFIVNDGILFNILACFAT